MPDKKEQKTSLTRLSDHFNAAARVGAAYGAELAVLAATAPSEITPGAYLPIVAVFAMLRTRYLREIPMALGNLLVMPFMARQKHEAPPEIQSITDEFSKKAGYSYRIKTYVYEKGVVDNAFSVGDRLYVGRGLVNKLSKDELRFVLGHEMAHSATQDISEQYLFWPPWIRSVMMCVGAISAAVAAPNPVTLATAAAAFGFMEFQNALWQGHSRTREFRADRNGLLFSGDLKAAQSALKKIAASNDLDLAKKLDPDQKSGLWDSHPCLRERIENLEKEWALMQGRGPKTPSSGPV